MPRRRRRWSWGRVVWPRLYPWLVVVLLAIWMTRWYWNIFGLTGVGFPYTHDGENHLARFMNYAAAWREGQWPPRFAPYLWHGFGYPVFNYNYPLGNMLAAPLIWLGWHPGRVFAVMVTATLSLGLMGWWRLLRANFSRAASLFGVSWFVTSSYVASALVWRGSLGEVLFLGLVPWLGWSWWQVKHARPPISRRWWIVSTVLTTAALWLSHNVLAMVMLPLIVLGTLYFAAHQWRQVVVIWITSWLLTAWFWLPAMGELNLVVLASDNLATQAWQHTLNLGQIWWAPLRFGFSRPQGLDNLGQGLGPAVLVMLVLILSKTISDLWAGRGPRHTWAWSVLRAIGLVAVITYGMSDASSWWWQHVPGISIVQFPWRLMSFITLLVPWIAAAGWPRHWRWGGLVAVLLMVWQLCWVSNLYPADRLTTAADYYLSFPHSSTTRNENRPRTLTSNDWGNWTPAPRVNPDQATVRKVNFWLGSRRSYQIQVRERTLIVEPTIYFPGWRTTVNDQPQTYDGLAESGGLIAYYLPPADQPYQINTSFTQRTPVRRWSELLSVGTAVAGLVWLAQPGLKKIKTFI